MKTIPFALLCLVLSACGGGDNPSNVTEFVVAGEGDVKYRITFNSSWSRTTHPDNFPSQPHYSMLIGATHNINTVFWDDGV